MADDKRIELDKQRQLIAEQLEKCKEDREHARKRRERERQARKLRDEAFDLVSDSALPHVMHIYYGSAYMQTWQYIQSNSIVHNLDSL